MFLSEIAASLYPWDLADEGMPYIADELMSRCKVNSIYLVGVMHFEKRPLTSLFYTHNRVRKYYLPENSRIYYKVDENNFKNTCLKPRYSDREFLKDKDWLDILVKEARLRGVKAGIELSHTIFDTNIARNEHPDKLQKNVYGNITNDTQGLLCSNHPDVHEYQRAMFYDVVKNHDVDFIQTCLLTFSQGSTVKAPWFYDTWMDINKGNLGSLLGVANGGCFCESCRKKAGEWGYDWDLIIRDMTILNKVANASAYRDQDYLMENNLTLGSNVSESLLLFEYPGLEEFLKFRIKSITELFKDIYRSVHEAKKDIDFRYNNHVKIPEYTGISFKDIAPYLDSVRDSDYTEQTGAKDDFFHKRNSLLKVRRGIGFDKPILAALAVRPNATPDIIKRSIAVIGELGMDGLSLGHYDGAHIEHLDSFREAIEAINVKLI
jgi:hypothetical protein